MVGSSCGGEVLEARVGAKAVDKGLSLKAEHNGRMLLEPSFEPVEGALFHPKLNVQRSTK